MLTLNCKILIGFWSVLQRELTISERSKKGKSEWVTTWKSEVEIWQTEWIM